MSLTNDKNDPGLKETLPNGQQRAYLVLSEEERAKGFVRPVRRSYIHVGIPGPRYPLVGISDEDRERYRDQDYAWFEPYPENDGRTGRYWTQAQVDSIGKGCRTMTTMGVALAETYARDPQFYGATFCCGCGKHLRVGEYGEFVWADTEERVGT